jgi:NAD(P)-dependent dehydrogenase (short-subunit alcohol dehydrogenase family)
MDLRLRSKVALITGSSRGIGLATAKAFAAEGCRVMLSARSAQQLREMEEALRETGAEVAARAADVGSPDGAARLIEVTVAANRGIDILANNVGGGGVARALPTSAMTTGAARSMSFRRRSVRIAWLLPKTKVLELPGHSAFNRT